MRARALASSAMLLFAGCKSGDAVTQLIVLVDSDLVPRREITAVETTVQKEGAANSFAHAFELAESGASPGADEVPLPFSFGVVPAGGDEDRVVTIDLVPIGTRPDNSSGPLFARRVVTRWVKSKTMLVSVFLSRDCITANCGVGLTCGESGCRSEIVGPNELVEIAPGQELARRDAGPRRDAEEDATAGDAEEDAATRDAEEDEAGGLDADGEDAIAMEPDATASDAIADDAETVDAIAMDPDAAAGDAFTPDATAGDAFSPDGFTFADGGAFDAVFGDASSPDVRRSDSGPADVGLDGGFQCDAGAPCMPGQVRNVSCGNCGTRTETCSSSCQWVAGSCMNQGVCSMGSIRTIGCGCMGMQTQSCSTMCTWVDVGMCIMSTCQPEQVCPAGICCYPTGHTCQANVDCCSTLCSVGAICQ